MTQELKITSVEKPEEKFETLELDISDDLFLKLVKKLMKEILLLIIWFLSIIKDGLKN